MKKSAAFWTISKIRHRIPMIAVLTGSHIIHALFSVLFALGTRGVIDSAVAGNSADFISACVRQLCIILVILSFLALQRHLRDKLHADLERDWKRTLLRGLLHGEYSAIQKYHSAELINRLNNDVTKVNDGILGILPGAASMITRLTASVVVLGILDLRFTVIIAVIGALLIAITGVVRTKLKNLNKRVSEHDGKVSGFIQETLEKLLMVQAMDVADEVERRSDTLLDDRYKIQRKRKNITLVVNTGISLSFYGIGFIALAWGAYRMLHGDLSFGSLTAMTQLVSQIQNPFVSLSGLLPLYTSMSASAERLMELDSIQGEPPAESEDPQVLYSKTSSIGAEALRFSYDRDLLLSGASFALPKGAFAVITGPSGIGKSTLLKLLLGIYVPEGGKLFFMCGNGQRIPIERSMRRMFAYVPQGNLLLSGSIRDNLVIVRPDATDEQIHQAVYVSAMDEFLPALPNGIDTVLGESGAGLSEGQSQRLAIARAILTGAPILLLDECTSALDEKTEQTVLKRLRSLPEITCIAVTHRPAATELCDWRLEMDGGKINAVKLR